MGALLSNMNKVYKKNFWRASGHILHICKIQENLNYNQFKAEGNTFEINLGGGGLGALPQKILIIYPLNGASEAFR